MSGHNRTRSSSKKLTQERPGKFSHSPSQNAKILPSIRIEERSITQLMNSKRKLETLKKNIEQEELKELRDKPKILTKSRILAERAEKRLLSSPPASSPEVECRTFPQVQPETQVIISQPKTPDPEIKENKVKRRPKRTKSLVSLSVIERSEVWLQDREQRINSRKKEIEDKDLAECTFSPDTQFKGKDYRSSRDYLQPNKSFFSSPYSIEPEVQDQNSKANRPRFYKQIAPYQVKVSFKCGIDLNSFLKRAK